jgi:ABC-type multidrug transport system ATPase subunit
MTLTVVAPPRPTRGATTERRVAVRVEGLSKRFSIRRSLAEIIARPFTFKYAEALRGVSCEIHEGEFFGLLGPNGAGKSTLFKTLATIVTPDSGSATVLGCDVLREPDAVRQFLVPVVADERSLRWRLSSRENLRLYAVLYGVPKATMADRIEEVLDVVQLRHTDNQMVGQFSSGMKQRLLIARALLAQPRVLLLDEPTRGLDPVSARRLRLFLRDEVCHRHGCTVLLATHNTEEAFEMCDRVGILERGRLLVAGSAARLAAQYSEPRYRLWTDRADHPALTALLRAGLADDLSPGEADGDGWIPVEMKVPGAAAFAPRVLEFLVHHGVTVARFERAPLSLADLIERVQLSLGEASRA